MRLKFLLLARKDTPPSSQSFYTGLANSLRASGCGVAVWNMVEKNAFDVFTELQPDYVILDSRNIRRDVVKCIIEFKTKPIFFLEGTQEKEADKIYLVNTMLEKGRFTGGAYPALFTKVLQTKQGLTHALWGRGALPCLPAVDLTRYWPVKAEEKYQCDLSFIGHRRNDKRDGYEKILYPLCEKYKTHVYGYGEHTGLSNHLGTIDGDETYRKIVASSKINLSFTNNPNSISERIFKIVACGGFCIAQNSDPYIKSLLSDEELFDKVEDLMEKIDFFLKEENLSYKKELLTNTRKHLLTKHTYFHRAKFILETLGEKNLKELDDNIKKVSDSV